MTNSPSISIIMPCYNSEKTLGMVLESIKKQTFVDYEILILDGGSTDSTREIATQYNCRIVENPNKQQEYAKHIGLLESKGKYLMYLDSDEVLENIETLQIRYDILEKDNIDILLFGGYIHPEGYSEINNYINCFADPFARFIYHIGGGVKFWINDLKKQYDLQDGGEYYKIDFLEKDLPLVDFCASNILRKSFVLEYVKNYDNYMIIPVLFYEMVGEGAKVGVLKEKHAVIHYSADSTTRYISKLIWRIKANIHYTDIPGTGFVNRISYQSFWYKVKKFLYIPYSLSIIFPLIDSIRRYIIDQKKVYFLHPYLCLVVIYNIIKEYGFKFLGFKNKLSTYGK